MLFLITGAILVVSFLIALFSLIRERRKIQAKTLREERLNLAKNDVEGTSGQAKEPIYVIGQKQFQGDKKKVDGETVTFPWEVNKGHDVGGDDRFPTISGGTNGAKPHLRGSVSLKDLKSK